MAPAQTAVAGVTAVGLALAINLFGMVLAPALGAEERRLLDREETLELASATGLTAIEARRVREFRARWQDS
jgi:hypothetical protein